MASKPKFQLKFDALADIAYEIDAFPGALEEAITEAFEASSKNVGERLEGRMKTHEPPRKHKSIHDTMARSYGRNRAPKAIYKDAKTEWEGNIATQKAGFDISHGGLSSIFLMYGTPRHYQPKMKREHPGMLQDTTLYNIIAGASRSKKLREMNREIFLEVLRKHGGHFYGG